MKRIISALLCAVMLLCILPVSAFAQDKVTPIILVQGYSGPALFYDLGGENEHQVWGINMDDLKKIVVARIPEPTPAPLTARILSPLASPDFSAGESFTVPATTGSLS